MEERMNQLYSSLLIQLCLLVAILLGQDVPIDGNYDGNKSENLYIFEDIVSYPVSRSRVDSNTTLIGRWPEGPCYAVESASDKIYYGNGGNLQIAEIVYPDNPVMVGNLLLPSSIKDIELVDSLAYIANSFSGLRIIDISDDDSLSEISSFDTDGQTYALSISGNYAYLADDWNGLRIVDISDPAEPFEVGSYTSGGFIVDVEIQGHYAYVADYFNGLYILNIEDPTNAIKVVSYPVNTTLWNIAIKDSMAYLAAMDGGLLLVSIKEPSAPNEVGTFVPAWDCKVVDVTLEHNMAFLSDQREGLYIIDVSHPQNPSQLSIFEATNLYGITIEKDRGFIIADGVGILDLSDFHNITLLTFIETGDASTSVNYKDNHAYITSSDGLKIIDISDMAMPFKAGEIDSGYFLDITIMDDIAYCAGPGIHIYDLSDPVHPQKISELEISFVRSIEISANYAYATVSNGIYIIDISSPAKPVISSFLEIDVRPIDIAIKGKFAFVVNFFDGLFLIDISDPRHPQNFGFLEIEARTYAIEIQHNMAYVACGDKGLYVFDITDVYNPEKISVFESCYVKQLKVSDTYLFSVGGTGGLHIIDISDPKHPFMSGYYDTGESAENLAVRDAHILVADHADGLYIIQNDLHTGLDTDPGIKAYNIRLHQNYPNPFNPMTTIAYSLRMKSAVKLVVYDIKGAEIAVLVNQFQPPGRYEVELHTQNMASGVYF
jgi:hypothetical protein